MKINQNILGGIIIVIIFGSIAVTSMLNLWKTENSKIPDKYKAGEYKGEYDPSDIRGSYSLLDIHNSFDVPVTDLAKAFGVTGNNLEEFKCKELETVYSKLQNEGKEVGTNSMRIFVALYKNLPIELDEKSYFPDTIIEVLNEKTTIDEKTLEYLNEHTVTTEKVKTEFTDNTEENNATEKENLGSSNTIKGKSTFNDLIDMGLGVEDIKKITGDFTNKNITVKEHCENNGTEFSEVKENLQKLLDN